MFDVIEKARIFACAAHAAVGQKRKYTNEPYHFHTQEVAYMVSKIPGATDEMIAAAHLHDVVEDTSATITDIHCEFGSIIASYVHWLTDVSTPADSNREQRKEKDRNNIRNAPGEVHSIKCCDIISNVTSIVHHDKNFAKIYVVEKEKLLGVLTNAEPGILNMAKRTVEEAKTQLNK